MDFHAVALAASGADLANIVIVNEAALLAVRIGHHTVTQEDLMESVETVFAGKEKKDRGLNAEERRMVAYHEAGHALVSVLTKDYHHTSHNGFIGDTINMPEEERYLLTEDELLAQITMLLGGRASEIVSFGVVTTGAASDIENTIELARKMVAQYGMSERFGSMGLQNAENQYLGGRNVPTCSERTGAEIDEEVCKILDKCENTAISL